MTHDQRTFACLPAVCHARNTRVKGPDKQQRNGGASDSLAKLAAVNALCAELGVLTAPALLGGLALLPLLAWHHQVRAACVRERKRVLCSAHGRKRGPDCSLTLLLGATSAVCCCFVCITCNACVCDVTELGPGA